MKVKLKWACLEFWKGEFDSWFSKEVMGMNWKRYPCDASEPMTDTECEQLPGSWPG